MFTCPNCEKSYPEIRPPQVIDDHFYTSEGWRISECQNCSCVWREEYKIVTTKVSIITPSIEGPFSTENEANHYVKHEVHSPSQIRKTDEGWIVVINEPKLGGGSVSYTHLTLPTIYSV